MPLLKINYPTPLSKTLRINYPTPLSTTLHMKGNNKITEPINLGTRGMEHSCKKWQR